MQRVLRRPEVIGRTGLSRTTIFNLEKAGNFPQHFMLTPRCAVWDEGEVEAWLDSRRKAPIDSAVGPDHTLRKVFPGRGRAVGVAA